ncbi:MAG TPA: glycosyl hydrolase [Thermomicrobiaceae bacterium]|nr:glycosyl hydrolase [Thermomicrobiaceae bacterium]
MQEQQSASTGLLTGTPGMAWRLIGPHRGGRVVAVAGDPGDAAVFYFGACAGGVWKTVDGGTYWENVSDGHFNTAAVGAIAVAQSDPSVIYVGTGETTLRGNVSHGDGVYRSTDGGKTWRNVGLADTRHIGDIAVHPTNPDVVFVAALGHAFGPNEERGVFRSKDGGGHWEKVLYRGPDAGAVDLSMDPANPRIIYATIYQVRRNFWNLTSGGPECGIFKTTDGGDTWEEITRNEGLPSGLLGKIGIAASPARRDRVYAIVEANDGAVFRSDDGGATWQRQSEQPGLRWRAWYYMHIYADPSDADTVWVMNGDCWKSIDGGKTFQSIPTPHGDNHDLWIDPHDSLRMVEGNDGGATVTYNGGRSWSTLLNQPTAQFYHVTTDTRLPYRVYGSQQDNTAITVPSMSVNGAIGETEWYEPGGGESGYIAVRPDDPNIVFAGAIGSGEGNGRLLRYDHSTGHVRNITVWPVVQGMGNGAQDLRYRFQWTYPILLSPHDPNVLYVTSNHVHRSTDQGMSWETISPDLTRNDPQKQQPSGGPITKDNTGAEVYDTIFAFAESPHERGVFWAGSDDGLIHVSRDNGASWQNVTPSDLPAWSLVSVIEVSPHAAGTAYVAATRYKLDEYRPYLFKTTDYGQSWRRIDGAFPSGEITRTVREDPVRQGLLYTGTETGVYVSFDDGGSWQRVQSNLPVCPIHDLIVKDSDLVVATHGRSFWILDDLSPLREYAPSAAGTTKLFTPRDTPRLKTYKGYGSESTTDVSYSMAGPVVVSYWKREQPTNVPDMQFLDAGKNPPHGVIVTYTLAAKPEGEVTLTFLTAGGDEIRTFSSKGSEKPSADADRDLEPFELEQRQIEGGTPSSGDEEKKEPRVAAEAGLHRFVWDMRYPGASKVPGDKTVEGYLEGPEVAPGTYQVRLSVDGREQTATFKILKDPRVAASQEDLQAQFDLLMKIRDKLSATHDAVNTARNLRRDLAEAERRAKGRDGETAIATAAAELRRKLGAVESALIQAKGDDPRQFPTRLNGQLAALTSFVESADSRPTRQEQEAYDALAGAIDAQLDALEQIVERDLPALEQRLRAAGVSALHATSKPAGA